VITTDQSLDQLHIAADFMPAASKRHCGDDDPPLLP